MDGGYRQRMSVYGREGGRNKTTARRSVQQLTITNRTVQQHTPGSPPRRQQVSNIQPNVIYDLQPNQASAARGGGGDVPFKLLTLIMLVRKYFSFFIVLMNTLFTFLAQTKNFILNKSALKQPDPLAAK